MKYLSLGVTGLVNMNCSFPTLEKKFYYDENMPSIYYNTNTRESVFGVGRDLGSKDPTFQSVLNYIVALLKVSLERS